jgi:hypothetical protein
MTAEMKCTKCGMDDRAEGQRWCKACRATWMRANRKPLTGEARVRANARSYAKVYLRRGYLLRGSCDCGAPGAEMHHEDYRKPLEVIWKCRPCHLALTREKRNTDLYQQFSNIKP